MAVSSTSEDRLQLGFNIQQQVESDNTDIQAEVDAYLAGNVVSSNGQLYGRIEKLRTILRLLQQNRGKMYHHRFCAISSRRDQW